MQVEAPSTESAEPQQGRGQREPSAPTRALFRSSCRLPPARIRFDHRREGRHVGGARATGALTRNGLRRRGLRGRQVDCPLDGDARSLGRELEKRASELADVRIALRAVFLQALRNDRFETGGNIGTRVAQGRGISVEDHRAQENNRVGVERHAPGQEPIENDAERPDVRARVDVARRRSCSGDMYGGEPSIDVVGATELLPPVILEMPKSSTLTMRLPSGRRAKNRLPGLRSR